jgi:polyisoprenyl-teichoic acid--peptidoglycan teichoic acid transferase
MQPHKRRAVPEPLGPRREALRERRAHARRKRLTSGGVAGVVAALVATAGVAYFANQVTAPDDDPGPAPSAAAEDAVITTLFFGTREDGNSAIWLTLLAYDTEQKSAAVIYVPAHSAVEVPARGLQGVGDSLGSGGVPLLLVSTENLLGIDIDHYVELTDSDARSLFEATGQISVDVPEDVRVAVGQNRARLIFSEGLQRLSAPFLVQLLYTRGLDSDDVELGSRHIAFWDGFLDNFAEDPEALSAAVRSAGGALAESDAAANEHARLLASIAQVEATDRRLASLPVQQVSVGGSELYAVDSDEVAVFMGDLLRGVRGPNDAARVQVLNGNGVPGIGQEVAEKLIGAGFRVVLTGNAPRLNYRRTLVITYDDSPDGQALAERAKDLIGVGEVQISAQTQGIVDLTIVIGKDFLRTR